MKKHADLDKIVPALDKSEVQATEIMGPLPEDALPRLSSDTDKPVFLPDLDEESSPAEAVKIESNDPQLDEAVRDISTKDSDKLLEQEDAEIISKSLAQKKKLTFKSAVSAWWHNRWARNLTFSSIIFIICIIGIIPSTRYAVLNVFGVKASTSFKVVDAKSGRPVKNVEAVIGSITASSDQNGLVKIAGVKLGKSTIVLKKRSFATLEQTVIMGWGSNPFDSPFEMTPVGSQYNFVVTDWLSGKPITGVEISDGESVALTGVGGKATLVIEPTESAVDISVKAGSYRTESYHMEATDKSDKQVAMVPAKPDVFVSKRSGKYDLYKKDLDGKNEVIILAGTGNEQNDIALLVHPSDSIAAFASSREGKRNADGYLLSNLYIVDTNLKTSTKILATEAESIRLIGWAGDKLIFVKVVAGPSGAFGYRQRVMSYDYKKDKMVELASANYFNDVELILNRVYFAPNSSGVPSESKLYSVNIDGSQKIIVADKETWSLFRTAYNKLFANIVDNKWYEVNLSDGSSTPLSGPPALPTNRFYVDSPSGSKSLWIDNRDGQGVLIMQDLKTNTEKVLLSKSGLKYPVRWLSEKHILYRIGNASETADYVINIDGGPPKKISDVTDTNSANNWYY